MKLLLNGEEKVLADGISVLDMLNALEIERRGIAVELNREVVPKGRHEETRLKEGDTVEVIRMVGGG